MIKTKNKKGFVILYTVLIASIILAIAIGVASVSYNEIVLSQEAREGNISFFAADTGAECALYWDGQGIVDPANSSFLCDGSSYSDQSVSQSDPSVVAYLFNLNNNTNCTAITINKNFQSTDPLSPCSTNTCTRIEAKGYNVPCGDITSSKRVVERAIRVTYVNATTPTGGGGGGGGGGPLPSPAL